jgi:hypothetical protein
MLSAPSNCINGVLSDKLLGFATVLKIEQCFLCGPCSGYRTRFGGGGINFDPVWRGVVEYLHRYPANRRRRRKEKPEI